MIQIWVAMISILILKFLKEMVFFKSCCLFKVELFVKIDLQKWIDNPFENDVSKPPENIIQGGLF